jgi:hypothetical protein
MDEKPSRNLHLSTGNQPQGAAKNPTSLLVESLLESGSTLRRINQKLVAWLAPALHFPSIDRIRRTPSPKGPSYG